MPLRTPQSAIRTCVLALLLGVAGSLSAQARGFRKTDLIRLLASGRPPGNVALQIRRRCLAFTPTPRDRFDLAAAGATQEVLDAISQCVAAATRPGGSAALRIVAPARVRATAGSEVTIMARLLRGNAPLPGKALEMRGATAIAGGSLQEPGAVTDGRGVATFRLLAGVEPGTHTLSIVAVGDLPAQATLQLITTEPALVADVLPPVLVVQQGSRAAALLRVMVRGRGGAPVAALPVELRGVGARLDALPPVTTDGTGGALFRIPPGALRGAGTLGVFARGTLLATVTARLEAAVISEDRTQFIAGTGQRGSVHEALRLPLAVEVRDTAGALVTGFGVRFSGSNADVSPAETATDSAGVARTTVTLGDRAGPATVTAAVGRVTRTTSFYAVPGPARTLVIERAGRAIDSMALASRDTVTLRVVGRDEWGNEALLTGLAATVSGGAVRLFNLRGAPTAPGTLVLQPRRTGTAGVGVTASGLSVRLPVRVLLPVVSSGWVYGARAGGAAFDYSFPSPPGIIGRPGARGELLVGRRLTPRLRVLGGAGFGVLRADDGNASLAVGLLQGLVRGEYALTDEGGGLVPVVTLGGGAYRIKSTDQPSAVYNTSLFFLFGGGVDYPLSPHVEGEFRVERQQLYEASSKNASGSVGALTIFEVGVRVTP